MGVSLAQAERNGSVAAAGKSSNKTSSSGNNKTSSGGGSSNTGSSSGNSGGSSNGKASNTLPGGSYQSSTAKSDAERTSEAIKSYSAPGGDKSKLAAAISYANKKGYTTSTSSGQPSNTQAGGSYQGKAGQSDADRTNDAITAYQKSGDKDKLAAALAYAKKQGYDVSGSGGGNEYSPNAANAVTPIDRADSVRQGFADRLDSFTPNGNTGGSSNVLANAIYQGLNVGGEDFSGADRYKNVVAMQNKFGVTGLKYADDQTGAKDGYVKVVQPNGTTSLMSKSNLDNDLRNATPFYNPNGATYEDTTGQNYVMTDQFGLTHGFDNKRNAAELNDYYKRLGQTTPLEAGKNAGNTYEYNGAVNGGYAVDSEGNRANVAGIEGSQPYLVGNDPKQGEATTLTGNLGKKVLSDSLMKRSGIQFANQQQGGGGQGGSGGVESGAAMVSGALSAPAMDKVSAPPQTKVFQTHVIRNGQQLAATIDANGVTTLQGGGRPQEGDIVQGRNQQYKVENGKGVAINKPGLSGALAGGQQGDKAETPNETATTVQLPNGSVVSAKIVNGITYMQNGERPPEGAIINTGGGKYIMKDGKGVPYNNNNYSPQNNANNAPTTSADMLNKFYEAINNPLDEQSMIKAAADYLREYAPDAETTNGPTWEEALKQSLEMSKDKIAMEDVELEKQINQSNLSSGLFGQIPGEVLKRETMLKQKGIQQKAINDLATSLYNSGVQQQQWQQQYNLQKQNQFLEVLNQTIERMTGQKQQNVSNLMAIYNALADQEKQAATNSYNQAKLQADIDYNNGKLTLNQYNAQVNAAYKNDSLGIAQQNANTNAAKGAAYIANQGKGSETSQKTAKQTSIDNYVAGVMSKYDSPYDLYAELERKGTGLPAGVTKFEVMERITKLYPGMGKTAITYDAHYNPKKGIDTSQPFYSKWATPKK